MLVAKLFWFLIPQRRFGTSKVVLNKLRLAIIGQSQFGAEVYKLLRHHHHEVVGVFTIPDFHGRPDPLALVASGDGVKVFKFSKWRNKGVILPEVMEAYKSVGAELNVLPFCTQFIPMDVINFPKHKSICYHPSLLPRHRGASAINWTLIHGDKKAGFTVFWADDGLDTGPILLQKECSVDPNDTVDSIYNRFLYPQGIRAMCEATQMVADGKARKIPQVEEGASYEPIMKKENAKICWTMSAQQLHDFIRGNDKVPGAWTEHNGEKLTLYGSRIWTGSFPKGSDISLSCSPYRAIVHQSGLLLIDAQDKAINISSIHFESGKMISASKYGQKEEVTAVELTPSETKMADDIQEIWKRILSIDKVEGSTNFFKVGGGSMEVVRVIEEVRSVCGGVQLSNEDVFMAPSFDEFVQRIVLMGRGVLTKQQFVYDGIEKEVKNMKVRFPHQLFINNEFVDSSDNSTFETINPADESVLCRVAMGTVADVDRAVEAASDAFYDGEWSKMNARDRGNLMYRLADLIENNKEELATIESLDSGAVYTLALKTHIGMSIEAFRYFAGWCDKIEGKTIPISHARPNKNLTFTKREPFGVCGIITPWNYPFMMLAWKLSSCLAAGNTVVLKPAQVTPLTSLKFGEFVVKSGFPPGVVNVVTGSGSIVGQAIAEHLKIRKIGFTGSTAVGKTIMKNCATSNIKKVSLELGGKSPLIIFSDCDLDKAVKSACSGVFFNKGENCIAAGRIFVEDSIHDQFVDRVIDEVRKMKIGNPLDIATDHGPQNHKVHLISLLDFCRRGVEEGAKLIYGGKRVERPGFYLHPTIFTEVEDEMFIAREESFGPIMIISRFSESDIDDLMSSANMTEFGLASGVFSRDISRALRVSDRLRCGTVFVNTYNKTDVAAPFGGFKQSGFGKDLGEEALNEYLQTKTVTIEY